MNVDIENITSKNKHLGDQYTTLVIIHFFQKQNYFQQDFWTNAEIIQMDLRTYQIEPKQP